MRLAVMGERERERRGRGKDKATELRSEDV